MYKKGDIVRFVVNSPDGEKFARKGQIARIERLWDHQEHDDYQLKLLSPKPDQFSDTFWALEKEIEKL